MKVSLLNCTPWALETLLMTKNTRLSLNAGSLDEVINWDDDKKLEQLGYMLDTIKSSWEFVDYIFAIEDVTRAFTHQLVRHRIGTSFAQQSQRTVDMSGFKFVTPDGIADDELRLQDYLHIMDDIDECYHELIAEGAKPEDARGVLPTNICTNIIFKANLRTLNAMCAERLCVKAQGEFQQVMKAIREVVIGVHPWAEPMLRVYCSQTGVCCFPRVTNCKIKDNVFNPTTGLTWSGDSTEWALNKEGIQKLWEQLEGRLAK